MFARIVVALFVLLVMGVILAAGALGVSIAMTYPKLPSLTVLTDYRPKIPLKIFTADGVQIGEFGEERRAFVSIKDVPDLMKQAILAAEDERFYEHGGIDYVGVGRAIMGNILTGRTQSGASTITMQVAKNFFLSSEKTYTRKFNEALLSFKIEHNLSKDKILELYFNQIYLGQRAYGFAMAAQTYYGKTLNQLSIAEMAMLAGLPKAPSSYNPVVNPERARLRQLYVLRRMLELQFITPAQYETAKEEPQRLVQKTEDFHTPAQYVAEMVRQAMVERYADEAYTRGFRVYTTIHSDHQEAAFHALRKGLMNYDRRHRYRGPEGFLNTSGLSGEARDEAFDEELAKSKDSGDLQPGIVVAASSKEVRVYLRGGEEVSVSGAGLSFARAALSSRLTPEKRIREGSIVRVVKGSKGDWRIVQMPLVEGAFVALDSETGAIKALVGGFDYNRNHYNRATQAWRQPGSSFKPFVYSAALERGLTASTMFNDAPLLLDPKELGGQRWNPKNYDGRFSGMMTMRQALTRSKNIVSVRILLAITPQYGQTYIQRFGFMPKQNPAYLTMSLGAGVVTPLQMAEAYGVFANGGYRVRSYFIDRIEDAKGRVVARTAPTIAGQNAERTVDPRNAFIMTSMMKDVVRYGTATAAMSLKRSDLAGKTGTTNDARDAWFAGYNPKLVGVAWVGFDNNRSLGVGETGGGAALPIWIDYMRFALRDMPNVNMPMPQGVVRVAGAGARGDAEYYYREYQSPNPNVEVNNRSTEGFGEEEAEGGELSPRPTLPAPRRDDPPSREVVENVKELLF